MSWEDKVRDVVPYIPGEQPKFADMVKLNTNECPYPPSPMVAEELKLMKAEDYRLYPDNESTQLVAALASYYHTDSDHIHVGVGSDDVLSQIFLTFFSGGEEIVFPEITYSFYEVWANLYKIPFRKAQLNEDWSLNPDALKAPGGVIFPNPNAPTGLYEQESFIRRVTENNPDCVVVVDEAYIDFGGRSVAPLTDEYDNLLVVQTFSKSRAMAGMRIGFAIGNPKLISYLKAVKYSINSYTMSSAAIRLGVAALRDEAYFKKITGDIMSTRERTKEELQRLGFVFPDSMANFIFARYPGIPGKELFELLRSQNIFVRHFDTEHISDYLRITIGTDEQMDRLLDFLRVYLG